MMITYKDIRIAINSKLRTLDVEINSRDVTEGFNRPSFFVQLENSVRSSDEHQVHKAFTIQIYYFPTDRYDYSVEVLDIQEQLENLFDLKLKVQDRFFNVDEAESVLTDGVLSFSFEIAFYDGRDVPYDVIIIEVDEEGNPVDEGGTPIEVPVDENGNPITDGGGKPISIEKMEILEME